MANNLTAVMPRLLAQGLMALRSTCVMPRLVNRDYDTLAQQKGSTVDVPIPSAIAVQDVSPNNQTPATPDVNPIYISVPLDQWKEAPFYLSDKDMKQAMEGIIPLQASEAISALADTVDEYILGLYKGVYASVGTAGTTPFGTGATASTVDAVNCNKLLNKMRAPKSNRRVVLDPDAEAAALQLRAFQDQSWAGADYGIKEGEVRRKFGLDWFMDQNVQDHTTGAAGTWLINGTMEKGSKEITVDGGTTKPSVGDIFTIANDTQQYVCKASTATTITIAPGLKKVPADNAALTFVASHTVNMAFHRDAFAFATRPLEDEGQGLGNMIMSRIDEVSGLALRLEISREYKRTRFSYDILYGGALCRPELAVRLLG